LSDERAAPYVLSLNTMTDFRSPQGVEAATMNSLEGSSGTRAAHKRASVWAPIAYLVVVAVAMILPYFADGAEAGIWAVLLTMPWPIIDVPLIDAIDPRLMDAGAGVAATGVGAIINAFILHKLLQRRERRKTGVST
jgi:hypothetical protein